MPPSPTEHAPIISEGRPADLAGTPRPVGFGVFLAITGLLGLAGALALSIEKIATLTNPGGALACDLSVLVQCSTNLDSAQGAVFGFPNPFLGLIGYALVTGAGAAVLAATTLTRWFFIALNLGVTFAVGFVIWLIGQSIFDLGTLCPWCLLIWAITIPLFLITTGWNLRYGIYGPAAVRIGTRIWPWLPLVTLLAYVAVAMTAQVQLDVLGRL